MYEFMHLLHDVRDTHVGLQVDPLVRVLLVKVGLDLVQRRIAGVLCGVRVRVRVRMRVRVEIKIEVGVGRS